MSIKDSNIICVSCGSEDAFVAFDFSFNGEKRGHCRSCGANWSIS